MNQQAKRLPPSHMRSLQEYLRKRDQMLPCMAGWMFGHIGADGEVWTCSTRAEPIGRLAKTLPGVNYHAGAIRYFKEVGQWPGQ